MGSPLKFVSSQVTLHEDEESKKEARNRLASIESAKRVRTVKKKEKKVRMEKEKSTK